MNAFQALAILASEERWCWNIYCTTCGHLLFRYAFVELAKGKSPESSDWIIHARRTSYFDEFGKVPRQYSKEVKDRVLMICQGADLNALAERCRFPDWLGYLGLVIHHLAYHSDVSDDLSRLWAEQLLEKIPKGTEAYSRIKEVALGERMLSLDDLEMCEQTMANS